MIERILRRLARAVHAAPLALAAACLAAAAASAVVVSRIPVKSDLLEVLPENNRAISEFSAFLNDFGMMDGLLVVVESPAAAPDLLIGMAESLGEGLAASPLVATVDYNALRSGSRLVAERFPVYLDRKAIRELSARLTPEGIRAQMRKNREALLSPLSSPYEGELIARDPLDLRGIVGPAAAARSLPPGLDISTGYYLDRGHTIALVMARPAGSARDMAFVRKLRAEVGRIAARARDESGAPPSVRVRIGGGYARAAEAATAIWRDMVVSFATSSVLVMALVFLAFRPRFRILAIFAATLFAALSWTLLFAWLLYGALNVVTSIVAAMLIGLYVDYMILTYKRFEEELRAGSDTLRALEATWAGTGKGMFSSALTTSVSFFSVVVTQFRGLHQLGVVAGAGVLLCLLATALVMSPLLVLLGRTRPALLFAGRPGAGGTEFAARLVERRPRVVVVAAACLLALSVAAATRIRFDTDLDSMGLARSESQEVERTIAERIGRRGEPLFLVARAADDARLAADFEAMERQGARWRAERAIGSFTSPGGILPPPGAQAEALREIAAAGLSRRYSGASLARAIREAMAREGLRPDPSLDAYAGGVARALAGGGIVDLPELGRAGDPRSAYVYNAGRKAIAAHLTPPDEGRFDAAGVARLRGDVARLGPDFVLTGPAILFDAIRSTIYAQSGLAILISFCANLLIVRLHFRDWRRVALVMTPVTAGTILTLGAMGALGIRFNFFNVAGIAIVFGYGVDYGIYLAQADAEGGGGGPGALRRTGGNIALCAGTTVASCGSLITTQFRGLASIGAVLCLGALFCLLSSLLLQPSLMRRRDAAGGAP